MNHDQPALEEIIGWDVGTWGGALDFWKGYVPNVEGLDVLELGANLGGLSLHFALRGARVLCSDLADPRDRARPLHDRYGADQIQYAALDAQSLELDSESYDLVAFKSVIGGIRRGSRVDPKPVVISEILRVLRPGGWLLFAENLRGAAIHMLLRRAFVRWSGNWDYLTLDVLSDLMEPFDQWHYDTSGVLALCGRTEPQRQHLARIDSRIERFTSERQRYCVYVAARKS